MKLRGQTIVMVPWFEADGMKQWVRMSFRGEIDKRLLYNKVIAYIKQEFGKTVSKGWVDAHCGIINEFLDEKGKTKFNSVSSGAGLNQIIEDWIERLQADEDESEPDSVLPGGDNESSELPLRSVPDSN